MRRTATLLIVALAAPLSGCGHAVHGIYVALTPAVQGSGKAVTVEAEVGDFTEVSIGGAIEAEVVPGEGPKVEIRGDDNIVPLVLATVEAGRLSVRMQPNTSIQTVAPLTVRITAGALRGAEAHGASRIVAKGVQAEQFRVEATGASTVELAGIEAGELEAEAAGASTVILDGRADSASIEATGASTIRAGDLAVESSTVGIHGASTGTVRATHAVQGDVTGASNLKVLGQPGDREVSTSGASGVEYASAD